jgi:hypothetical protein
MKQSEYDTELISKVLYSSLYRANNIKIIHLLCYSCWDVLQLSSHNFSGGGGGAGTEVDNFSLNVSNFVPNVVAKFIIINNNVMFCGVKERIYLLVILSEYVYAGQTKI